MTPKEYQPIAKEKFEKIYTEVETEWSAMKGNQNIYLPQVDLAIGPFSIDDEDFSHEYNRLMNESKSFFQSLIEKHNENIATSNYNLEKIDFGRLFDFNENARCLLCIEIENRVSRKHLMGGVVNASALGRIGILIPWTEKMLSAVLRQKVYLNWLRKVGKNSFKTDNVLILTKHQLDDCLDDY